MDWLTIWTQIWKTVLMAGIVETNSLELDLMLNKILQWQIVGKLRRTNNKEIFSYRRKNRSSKQKEKTKS